MGLGNDAGQGTFVKVQMFEFRNTIYYNQSLFDRVGIHSASPTITIGGLEQQDTKQHQHKYFPISI